MESLVFLVVLIIGCLTLFALISVRLEKAYQTVKLSGISFFRGNQVGLGLTWLVFLAVCVLYENFVPMKLVITIAIVLVTLLLYLITFSPFCFVIRNDGILEIRSIIRKFEIPLTNIKKYCTFIYNMYIIAKKSEFPFGWIPLGYYYLSMDSDLEKFVKEIQRIVKDNEKV